MSTVLWTFHNRDIMRRNQMSRPNSNPNATVGTNAAAPSRSSFAPGFIPRPSSGNRQVPDHLAPRAFNHTEGCSASFLRGANSRGNGQLAVPGSMSQRAPREPSGAYAVRHFHPENSQHSLPQRPPQQQKASSSSSSTVTSERYKTELCRPFEESGMCRYGQKCQFAHGSRELRTLLRHPKYKTEPCRTFHSVGFCPYGTRCHFIHNQQARQPVPSGNNTPREQSSTAGSDAGHSGFNREPQPRLQTVVSSASSSGLPSGHSHPAEAPGLVNQPTMNSGMVLPSSHPAANVPSTCCAAVAAASAAASAAAVFYRNGGVPCNTCANNTFALGRGTGGYTAPMALQNQNLASSNAAAYYHQQQQQQQQQSLAAPGQFPMPMARPPAAVAPTGAAAVAPGAVAAPFVTPGTGAAAAAAPAGTAAAHTTTSAASGAEGPEQHFSFQLPDARSESPEFDMLTRNLDSLLSNGFDNLLSCSSSSSSLSGIESPSIQPSRRLPIFSRFSDSDK
ncbi:zinc finger protein 36 C3H type-like 3 [Cricetulus griseus]|uniref:mRNA decay activator protein ZFP36 n=1 Tax=Cricetulus griseus TaxID=10029 RepID=A0A8C2LJZ6_CRIGR